MIKKYFNQFKSDRTKKANLNTIISLFFRGGSIILSFILVPLTINYIKPDAYGIWITLTSLVGWMSMFDIGIANGLKNKLSESLAEQNYEKGRMYVSTTYIIIGMIAFSLICIYLVFYQFLNWQIIFNSSFIPENKLRNVVTIVAVLFLLKFVSDIINVVSASYQMVSVSSILLFLTNLGITFSVWILSKTSEADMILLAFCLSFIPFLISVIASIYLFKNNFKNVKPSFKYVNFKESKSIVSLGSQFFILQIIGLIIFQTDNVLIAQFFSTVEVTNFNIVYKYYSVINILFTILLMPYWTAFTEAYHNNDFNWIKRSIKKLRIYWVLSIIVLIFMFFMANLFINLWIGSEFKISFSLSLSICAYIGVSNWNAIFANFSNGVGKLRVQISYAIIMGIVNIPLCFFLVKILNFGTFAMPLSNFICLIFGSILSYIQYVKIINRKAEGIWNK